MKKILLSLLILGAGAIALGRLRQLANEAQVSIGQHRPEWIAVTNRLLELNATRADLQQEVKAKKVRLKQESIPTAISPRLLDLLQKGPGQNSPWPVRAELREHLGIRWDNSADYVLVSKTSFKKIYLNGVDQQGKLKPTACAVLAITPDEQTTIEALLQDTATEHAAWLKTNVLRVEPSGNIVAKYTIPANPELAKRLEQQGLEKLLATLGPERAELFRDYAQAWYFGRGTFGQQPIDFTVRRFGDDDQQRLRGEYASKPNPGAEDENSDFGVFDVTPSSFPELFLGVFPGGWRELAQREGFDLPKEFQEAEAKAKAP